MLVCGVNGALTRADENEVGEQQLTPRAPLNCQSPARRSTALDREGGKEIGRRKRQNSIKIGQHEDGPRRWRAAHEKLWLRAWSGSLGTQGLTCKVRWPWEL